MISLSKRPISTIALVHCSNLRNVSMRGTIALLALCRWNSKRCRYPTGALLQEFKDLWVSGKV
jgi:hypothetical protein